MFLISRDTYQIKTTKTKGRGVFALKHIPAGTVIGDYIGRIMDDKNIDEIERADDRGCYSFEYVINNASIYPLDIKASGVHLINHSCAANCSVFDYKGHNLFFALRLIFPGEELTLDYEFDPKLGGDVSPCLCGGQFCRGTMYARVEKFGLKKKKNRNLKKREVNYEVCKVGEVLEPLKKYPEEIKDNPDKYNIYANLDVLPLVLKDKKLPSMKVLRERIRLTGRRLKFLELNLTVLAIIDEYLAVKR